MEINYIITNFDKFNTINQILKEHFKISTRLLSKLIRKQKIYLNNYICNTKSTVNVGDKITILFDYNEDNTNIIPTKMDLDIVYEDDWILIINKPAGIATHPSALHLEDTLSNGVKFYFDTINLKKKIRPVNRLDLNTSGLVVFAKCEFVQELLISQMSKNEFKKEYLCLAVGYFENTSGSINMPIARKENSIIERCINKCGKPSITHYTVIKQFNDYALVRCSLETGRTHQIRVHLSSISHPLLGDSLYGNSSTLISRQALHCCNLKFIHPIKKTQLDFSCALPSDIEALV